MLLPAPQFEATRRFWLETRQDPLPAHALSVFARDGAPGPHATEAR